MSDFQAILFDLDGTLADTAPDLANALNKTLNAYDQPSLPFEKIRPVVSHGGIAMIRLAFDIGPEDENYEEVRKYFLDTYLQDIAAETKLFAGMEQLLDEIEQREMKWGVVTNKPSWLTNPLMDALNLSARAATIVSGDTAEKSKPHPAPMFYACNEAGIEPARCIYMGDAERDIAAGRAAGMRTIAALFGYLLADDVPAEWGADIMIEHPAETWAAIESWKS